MDSTILCLAIGLAASTGEAPMYKSQIKTACKYAGDVVKEAEKNEVDPITLASLIFVESAWRPNVVSSAGACGLTQVIPRFVKESCSDLKNPRVSIKVGARILKYWLNHAEGKWPKKAKRAGLACYNAGWACLNSRKARYYSNAVLNLERKLKNAAANVRKPVNQ